MKTIYLVTTFIVTLILFTVACDDDEQMSSTLESIPTEDINELQADQQVLELFKELVENEAAVFSGLWIEDANPDDYHINVAFTCDGEEIINNYLDSYGEIAGKIQLHRFDLTLSQLISDNAGLGACCRKADLKCTYDINLRENRVELYTLDPEETRSVFEQAQIELPASVEIVQVDDFNFFTLT